MPARKKIDIEELKRLYFELKSIRKVAKALKVGRETVRERLVENKVDLQDQGRPTLGEKPLTLTERVRRHRSVKVKKNS